MKKKSLIVIIPAYNEEKTIGKTLTGLRGIAADVEGKGLLLRLYVVNDGSEDNTKDVATAAGADRIIAHKRNRGLGAAVRTGLTSAHADGAAGHPALIAVMRIVPIKGLAVERIAALE